MVKHMLWTSGGRSKPEMILEGFSPGTRDRWTVEMEGTTGQNLKYEFTYALDNLAPPPALQQIPIDEHTACTGGTSSAIDEI
jgi:hypothetical protein